VSLLSYVQVADYWIGAGGPRSRAVEWVAIAMGESGRDPRIVSPAGAIGLWQIMPFNAAPNGFSVAELYDPAANARVAVLMSGGGQNCAAWDSCYRDIQASGRYTYLAYPESGSPDYMNIPIAAAELQGHGLTGTTGPPPHDTVSNLAAAAAAWQHLGEIQIPAVIRSTVATSRATAAVGRRGWRP
jgi:Transglycosylase SLT domain